jgi:hypothetical protein
MLHDRYLSGKLCVDEATARHWLQGTSMFKEVLSKPIANGSRDALWASAALLGCIQFAGIDARTPEEAWPLKPYCPTDLDWLKMSDGKKAVFKIADPLRPDSVFRTMKVDNSWCYRPINYDRENLMNVTRDFADLFSLGPNSTGENNPYHLAALAQARTIGVDCTQDTLIEFMSFIGQVKPELMALLHRKDPKALLLVVCWYAKVYKYQWWIQRRGLLEGRAICIYLDRYHGDDSRIQRLLQWPKKQFGLPTWEETAKPATAWSCPNSSTVLCVV